MVSQSMFRWFNVILYVILFGYSEAHLFLYPC